MVALSDFNKPVVKPKLSDFAAVSRQPKPVAGPPTINSVAAFTAVLGDPASVASTYRKVSDQLNYGTSKLTTDTLAAYDAVNLEADYKSLVDIAADDTLTTEQRATAVQQFSGANTNRIKTLSERAALSAAMANSSPDDNDETEFTRIDAVKVINEVDAYRGDMQKRINQIEMENKPDLFTTVKDVVELILPFYEGVSSAQISNAEGVNIGTTAEAITLLGNNKAAIRDALKSMPIADQKVMAEKLIKLVINASGPTAFTQNNIIMMEELNSFLQGGSYSAGDQLVDNMFSLLDSTILLAPFSRPIKGLLGGAGRLLKGSGKVEEATIRRYEAAMEALAEPAVVDDINSVVAQVAPPTGIDTLIGSSPIMDELPSAAFSELRTVLGNKTKSFKDLSVEEIMGELTFLDSLSSEKIQEVRNIITTFAGQKNRELDALVNEDSIKATGDIIADKVINSLEELDDAPSDVYADIRKAVSERVNGLSISNPTLAQDILDDVNAILNKKNLDGVEGKQAGGLKGFITSNVEESVIRRRMARTTVQPMSVSQVYKDVNPGKTRLVHEAMVADETGQMAQATYGTTREEAIGNDLLPEIGNVDGTVRNKVAMDESAPQPDQSLIARVKDGNGRTELTNNEKSELRASARDTWLNVQGLHPRREMMTINDTDSGVSFDMVYGPKDGGFSDPSQALEQAKYGLRKYGVSDDQIEILKRNNRGEYEPTTDYSVKGDYLIRVKHDYEYNYLDVVDMALTSSSPKLRIFEAMPGPVADAAAHLIPSTSVVDKLLLDAASVAADKQSLYATELLRLGSEYAKKYAKLDATQKRIVEDYIIRANAKGLKFNPVALEAAGMTLDAVDTVRSWKKIWDTLYHFENVDIIKTLRERGFQRYVDVKNNTDLIARPIAHNQTNGITKVFDGFKVRGINAQEIKDIYDRGGTLAKTRGKVELEDDAFDYAIVDNHPSGSYLRNLRDDEQILAYRDGYYTIRYDAPYFITKRVKGEKGEFTKAIATAGDRKLAEAELARLRSTDIENAGDYTLRGDLKKGTEDYENAEWEAMVSHGRTAQRVRGVRLKVVGETESDLNKLHIERPEESLVNSIRSLANRISHRDYVNTAKERFKRQFGGLLKEEKGHVLWPEDTRQIGANNLEVDTAKLADARATYRYINMIDNGYTNLLDDVSKNFFNTFADQIGRQGWGWADGSRKLAEKGLRAVGDNSLSRFARKKAFRLLLASNPLRQLPVQAMQALPVILATNPTGIPRVVSQFILVNYINRGGDVDSFFRMMAKNATGLTKDEAKELVKNYKLSGFEAAVKAHSLIRDDIHRLVDRTFMQKVGSAAGKPLDFLQKIGFEAGENILMRSVWLSEYDKLRKVTKGRPITMHELDKMNAKVRHLTLNMNRAGELPYNQNSLSMALQFFQAPHKAFAQIILGHKGLTSAERAKLATSYILTYGLGGTALTSMIASILPRDPVVKETLEGGFFNLLMNKTLSTVYGDEVQTDFSDSLRLLALPNVMKFAQNIWELQIGEALTSSASVGLVFGDNPRVTRFVQALARPFMPNNERTPEEFLMVGKAFFNIFSGASNTMKALYILEAGKSTGNTGNIVDYDVNNVEALMKAAGFSTIDEVHYYAYSDKAYTTSQKFRDDVTLIVKETSRRLMDKGISNNDAEYWIDMMAEAARAFDNDPVYVKEFRDQLNFRATQGDTAIFERLLKMAMYTDRNAYMDLVDSAPIPPEQKETLIDSYNRIERSE